MTESKTFLYRSAGFITNRDSTVNIATGNRLDDLGGRSSSPGSVKNFLFSLSSRPAVGSTQPPIQWVRGVKRPGREADHSPPTSAEVKKNVDLYIHPPPPIRLHCIVLNYLSTGTTLPFILPAGFISSVFVLWLVFSIGIGFL
jgi:hypothetical protein